MIGDYLMWIVYGVTGLTVIVGVVVVCFGGAS